MKVAIVGSRNYPDLEKVKEYIGDLSPDDIIILGGAKGVDETAEERINRIEKRDQLKHTIGNLTFLTGSLNPAISHGSFKRKRKEILKHSAINLNRFINETNSWNETTIQARSRKLFTVIKKTWPYPNTLK